MKIIVPMAASVYKWFFIPVLGLVLTAGKPVADHPFHVSVIEINHNTTDKTLEISCKIFTDDFEKTLSRNYGAKADLINPPNKAAMDSLVKKYIFSHLMIKVNGKPASLSYVGFENENEAAYAYVEVENVPAVSGLNISTNIMYDQFDDQMNILHITVGGNRKSTKLNYPDREASFAW
jgi:hypothetical protein